MPQVYGDDEPIVTGAGQDTDLADNQDSGSKKSSIFGKLKEKTKKAGSKIKSKVGRKKSDDTTTPGGVEDDDEDDEEESTEDLPSSYESAPPAAPDSGASQFTAPESTPRAYGSDHSSTFDSAPSATPDSGVSQYTAPESAPRAFGSTFGMDSGPDSAAPTSGYEAPPTSSSDLSKDIAAGTPYDSSAGKIEDSDAQIPEGIMKPKDFDTMAPETPARDVEPIVPYTETELNQPASTPGYASAGDKVGDLQSSVPDHLTAPFESDSTEESRGFTPATESKDETPDFSTSTPDDTVETTSESKDYTPEATSESKDYTPEDTTGSAPSYTDKAAQGANVAKDTLYGGAAALAGAVGYNAYSKSPEERTSADTATPGKTWSDWASEKTQQAKDTVGSALPGSTPTDKSAGDYASDAQGKTEELGDRSYDSAVDAKDTVADKANEGVERTKDTFSSGPDSSGPDVPGSATEAAYETRDAAQSKAADLNNATDDSETYTQKAANTAYAAKDKMANTLGLDQPSQGPSVVDKAKDYLGSAVATTQAYTQSALDTTKDQAGRAKDTTGDYAGSATDTTKDYTGSAVDSTKDNAGAAADTTKDYATSGKDTVQDNAGSAVDTSKDYAGRAYDTTAQYAQAATDTTKDYTQQAVDATKNYTQAATDTTKDYATKAKDTTVDTVTPKQEDKALSEQVTETLSNLPAQMKNTVASYTQSTTAPAAHDDAASPGIVGRLTGLFGFGKKEPEHHAPTTTTPQTGPTTE